MKFITATTVAAVLACAILITSCKEASDPNDPNNTTDPTNVAVTQLGGFPTVGGDVSGVALRPDGSAVAIINGKLYEIASPGATPTLLTADNTHLKVAVGLTGEIYTVTRTDFRTYTNNGASLVLMTFPPGTVTVQNGYVTDAKIMITKDGTPIVTIVNQLPNTYVFSSSDKGQTWQQMEFKLASGGNISLRFDSDVAELPNGDLLVGCASTISGLFKSTDKGATWTKLPGELPNAAVKLMINAAGHIYSWIPGGGQLQVSKNGGASFETLTPFNAPPFFTHVVEAADGKLYGLASELGLVVSTDAGRTWKTQLPVLAGGQTPIPRLSGDLCTRGSAIVVGCTEMSNASGGGVVLSTDNAASWASSGLAEMSDISAFDLDKDDNLLVLGNGVVARRLPSGAFQTLAAGMSISTLAASPGGQIIAGSPGSLQFSSDNGSSWMRITDLPGFTPGIGSIVLPAVIGLRSGGFLLSIANYRTDLSQHSGGALYKFSTNGVPTKVTSAPPGPVTRLLEDLAGNLYASIEIVSPFTGQFSSESYKSVDGGMTWTKTADVGISVLAVNSQAQGFGFGGTTGYQLGLLGIDSQKSIKLVGYNSSANYLTRARFDSGDRLYFSAVSVGMFRSDGPVR